VSRRKASPRRASKSQPRNSGEISVAWPGAILPGVNQWLNTYEAGMYLTTDEATRVSPVYCAMDTIVRAIAPCPWNVYDVKGRHRDLRPDDGLTYLLNTRANPWTTAIAFREGLLWSALGYGNGYAEIQFDNSGRVAALWNLDPRRVQPQLNEHGELGYHVLEYDGGWIWVDPWRIFHLRNTAMTGYVGDNPIWRAARSIAAAAAAQQFAAAYYQNGTVLSGYFTYPKAIDPKTKEVLEKDWREKHSAGPSLKHKSPILPPGMEWKPLTSDPEKSQLIETRQFSVPDVARWFGVPLHLLMDPQGSQGYGTNIEQGGIQFVNGCLHPWAERHEQEADWKLLPPRPATRQTKIDLSRHMKGAFDARMTGYATAKKAGILNQNEIREMEGWNTVGSDGDAYFVESSVVPVERALEPPPPPMPAFLPPHEPEEDEDEEKEMPPPGKKRSPASVARLAIALDRFERRMSARRADLEKHAPDKVEANLAELRKQIEPALVDEFRAALDGVADCEIRAMKAADAVLSGEPAHLAAERMAE
jgi:HK97 family phage portal protein